MPFELFVEARAQLGNLPPEVAALIDVPVSTNDKDEDPAQAATDSFASTIAGTATAIAPTDADTATRLREVATDRTGE